MPIYTRNQAKRQRTASVAKRIPMVLLTNILQMKHEMEVAEWREEHKQQFAPVMDVIERMNLRGWELYYDGWPGVMHWALHNAGEWRERAQEEGYWPVPSTRSAFEEAEAQIKYSNRIFIKQKQNCILFYSELTIPK
jgi:hypothetical protein